jgi:hypothetical protein
MPIAERHAAPRSNRTRSRPEVKVTGTPIPVKAAGMAMLLSAINPTNPLLTGGGRAAIT